MIETERVLWVASQRESFALARNLFKELGGHGFRLECARNFKRGLQVALREAHAVCLVDYDLGARTGIELLRESKEHGGKTPIIWLTPQATGTHAFESMRAGQP